MGRVATRGLSRFICPAKRRATGIALRLAVSRRETARFSSAKPRSKRSTGTCGAEIGLAKRKTARDWHRLALGRRAARNRTVFFRKAAAETRLRNAWRGNCPCQTEDGARQHRLALGRLAGRNRTVFFRKAEVEAQHGNARRGIGLAKWKTARDWHRLSHRAGRNRTVFFRKAAVEARLRNARRGNWPCQTEDGARRGTARLNSA